MGTTKKSKSLFKDEFYIAIDADVIDAMKSGELTPNEFLVWVIINRHVDFKTGIFKGCAEKIEGYLDSRLKIKTIQDTVSSLCVKHRVKTFHKKGRQATIPYCRMVQSAFRATSGNDARCAGNHRPKESCLS